MIAAKFDPNLFFQRADNVALRIPASEIFGLLKRTLPLPAQWGALVRRTTGDHALVRAGSVLDGSDVDDVLFARMTPIEVVCDATDIASRDGFLCHVNVRLMLSLVPERSELLTFAKAVLGGHRVAQAAGVSKFLEPTLVSSLAAWAASRSAAELIDPRQADATAGAVADALQAPLFSAGLQLEGRPMIAFDSDAVRQVRRAEEQASRHRAEQEAARQVQLSLEQAQTAHLDHLATSLQRLRDLASASPDAKLPELLHTFSERERGELYAALFANETPSARTEWIVTVDAHEVLFFTPGKLDAPARRLMVDGPAGPLRSIQAGADSDGRPVLWIGAATGVYRLPLDRAAPDLVLLVPDATAVKGGFNSVAATRDRVFASHSELGLIEWTVSDPTSPRPRFASLTGSAKAVRDVRVVGDHVFASVDNIVISWHRDYDGDEPPIRGHKGSVSTITAVCPAPAGLFAGNADGDVLVWERDAGNPQRLHTGSGRPVESIQFMDSHGVRRIIYTDTSLCVHARVLGDNYVCRYEAGGQTLRRVEAAPDLIVATNDLRDRLICWKPGEPSSPAGVIPVSRLTRRSVQDVCLI